MTDDELIDLLAADSTSDGYDSEIESGDRSSSLSEDTSPNPDIKLYPVELCPGIKRTGNTPDIPWWQAYGENSEAEAFLDMVNNGLKCDEATRKSLIDEVAELKRGKPSDDIAANEEISNDVSDIIDNMENIAFSISEDDDMDVARSKSDYNEVLASTMELQINHRQRIA